MDDRSESEDYVNRTLGVFKLDILLLGNLLAGLPILRNKLTSPMNYFHKIRKKNVSAIIKSLLETHAWINTLIC